MVYAASSPRRVRGDALGASVLGIRSALEVAETFELAEQVVDRLLAHPSPGGELGRSRSLGPGVQEEVQVGDVQIVEFVLVQPSEHPLQHSLPGHPQESADQWRPEGLIRTSRSKGT
jgi:hypothetical protein